MTEFDDMNQKAWEVAAQSIMIKNKKFETYSKGQVRGIFELARSNNFEKDIEAHVKRYSPQPSRDQSRNQRPQEIASELSEMRALNEKISKLVMIAFKNMEPAQRMRFSQYLMWNIRIIEQRMPKIDEIKLVLDCEGIKDPKSIIEYLAAITKKDSSNPPGKSGYRERYQEQRR